MQKLVVLVLCASLFVSSHAFIGNDGLSSLFFLNMMQGRRPLDMSGLFGGARAPAQTTGTQGSGSAARTATQRRSSPFGSIFNLALINEMGLL